MIYRSVYINIYTYIYPSIPIYTISIYIYTLALKTFLKIVEWTGFVHTVNLVLVWNQKLARYRFMLQLIFAIWLLGYFSYSSQICAGFSLWRQGKICQTNFWLIVVTLIVVSVKYTFHENEQNFAWV